MFAVPGSRRPGASSTLAAAGGGVHDHADVRRSIDILRALPGFVVEERPDVRSS